MDILPDTGLPSAGNYGHNITSQVVPDHVERMPYRRDAAGMGSRIGMSPLPSPPTT